MSNIESVKDLQELVGKEIDFFLEDDMFEVEGMVKKENEQFIVEITGASEHTFEMAGKFLEIKIENKKTYLKKLNSNDEFVIFINKVYKSINNPTKEELCALTAQGIYEFFRSSDETIIAYNDTTGTWLITFFGDDLPSGKIKSYKTLEELYDDCYPEMKGKWEAIYYKFETWHP